MKTNANFIKKIKQTINACGSGALLVHTDVMFAMAAVKLVTNAEVLLTNHIKVLEYCASNRRLLFPAFNYQFPKTKKYCLATTPSEVGRLSEFARTHWSTWRTEVPMYNFCGIGDEFKLSHQNVINPFGAHSVFAEFTHTDGVVLMYGTSVDRSTIIHYIEQMLNNGEGPLYRYDKEFHGIIRQVNGTEREVTLVNHVRPLDKHLAYDWDKIECDLLRDRILKPIKEGSSFAYVYLAKELFEYLMQRAKLDPYYLIDAQSKHWVEPMVEKLGRRFLLLDFES